MINSEMEILKSQELMRQTILRMKQAGTPIFDADSGLAEADQIAALQGMIAVAPMPQSNVIEIDLFAKKPEKGRTILAAITDAYLARHAQLHGSTGAAEFFESQKRTLRERVADSEARLAAFVDREGLVLPEDQIRAVLKDAARGSDAVSLQVSKIRGLEQRITTLNQQMAATPVTIEREVEHVNPLTQGLGLELSKKEGERTALLQNYTEEDRSVQNVTAEIAALRAKIQEEKNNSIIGTSRISVNPVRQDLERRLLNSQMNLDDLKARVAGMQAKIDQSTVDSTKKAVDMRQKTIELTRLQQEVSNSRDAYQLYEKKQEEARISEALDNERFLNVSVLEGATLPTDPSNKMNPLIIIAALVAGTGLGIGTAIGLEFLSRNFKFEEQVEQYLELPVFAVIPDMSDIAEGQQV
jgi:succinoglycan biosynthesis transport protein ExoP